MRRALLCVPQFGVLCGVLLLAACADTAESSSSRIEQESESEAALESTLDRTQQETEQGEANFPFNDASSFREGLARVKVGDKSEAIVDHLKKQRDTYRYIHDQALRMTNQGLTMIEVAEQIEMPPTIAQTFSSRGYYGSVNHDTKSAYVQYLGWFDGNPATLHQLPPVEASKHYVEFMGGAGAVLRKAQEYYNRGEYRWVAQVVNHVVFADPSNQAAKNLQADALEQLGYQAESGPWRNFYLTGAQELRKGVAQLPAPNTNSPDMVRAMSLDLLFDYMGVRLDGPKAFGKTITINLSFTDTNEQWVVFLENAALSHSEGRQDPNADVTLTLTRETLNRIVLQETTLQDAASSGDVQVDGNLDAVTELLSLLVNFEFWFNIVTP